MYRFSRSIYRAITPRIAGDEVTRSMAQTHILEATEATLRRLARDGRHFARPSQTLFKEIRGHFGLGEQIYVYMVVDRYLSLAVDFIEAMPAGTRLDGQARACPASTRQGTPCQREPRAGLEYCPSHRHLEETFPFGRLVASEER